MNKYYSITTEKQIGDETWALIHWAGRFSNFNELIAEIFGIMGDTVQYSRDTKQFYVRKDVLGSFDMILADFGATFTPNDGGSKASKLDKAFK